MSKFFQAVTVKSNCIDKIAYHGTTLSVMLRNGNAYSFIKVPKDVATSFLRAKSKGRFFNQEIVGNYDSEKLEEAS